MGCHSINFYFAPNICFCRTKGIGEVAHLGFVSSVIQATTNYEILVLRHFRDPIPHEWIFDVLMAEKRKSREINSIKVVVWVIRFARLASDVVALLLAARAFAASGKIGFLQILSLIYFLVFHKLAVHIPSLIIAGLHFRHPTVNRVDGEIEDGKALLSLLLLRLFAIVGMETVSVRMIMVMIGPRAGSRIRVERAELSFTRFHVAFGRIIILVEVISVCLVLIIDPFLFRFSSLFLSFKGDEGEVIFLFVKFLKSLLL